MATCPTCGDKSQFWNRNMFTGVCANCLQVQAHRSPQRKKPITNRQYKTVGLLILLAGGALVAVILRFGFVFKEAGPLVLFVAAALMGIVTFFTITLRLVLFLGPTFLVSGILADMLLDGDFQEDWSRLILITFWVIPWLMHCIKTPIESAGDTLETTDNTEAVDDTPPQLKLLNWVFVWIAILMITVGFSWPFIRIWFASEDTRALIALEKLGARTKIHKDGNVNITFNVSGVSVTNIDAGLPHCSKITNLTGLYFHGNTVSGAGLAHLQGLTGLKYLSIRNNAKITSTELSNLAGLLGLTSLDLSATGVTDAGLLHLRKLADLSRVTLHDCHGITDAAVRHLKVLKSLTLVDLTRTEFTDSGYAELKKALPKCEIRYSPKKSKAKPRAPPVGDQPAAPESTADTDTPDPTPPEDE